MVTKVRGSLAGEAMVEHGAMTANAQPLRKEDARAATDVLCAALADDPGWAHVVPDPRVRASALQVVIGVAVRDARPFGSVQAAHVDSRLAGAAIWLPPGAFPMTWQRRARVMPRMAALALRAPRHMRNLAKFGSSVEAAFPDEPAWYLVVLGVAPAAQRKGVGTALMRPMLDRADQEDAACYLETANPRNVGYYQAMGFTAVQPGAPLYDGGPPMWTMLRPPAPDTPR